MNRRMMNDEYYFEIERRQKQHEFSTKINQFKNESDDVSATANDASATSCNDATSVR
jgi:hypothetical protein